MSLLLICLLLITIFNHSITLTINWENLEDIYRLGLHNFLKGYLYDDAPRQNASYDFIIVGAGSAGCVLANRLSENPKWQVYLIEAGGTENFMHQVPALTSFLQGTHSNWGYRSEPQKFACLGMHNRQCSLPRGKILGGTSSINFMIYNRGNRDDYNSWAIRLNNRGHWSYDDVLPYFLKSENAQLRYLEESPYHNHSGPLNVEDVAYRSNMVKAYVKAAQEAGHPYNDYNGETQMGVSYVQATTKNGRRHSAFKAYIEPIRYFRKNLHIVTLARVTKILINPNTLKAYGVKMLYRNSRYTIMARKEIILSAGTFHSPQLLMLSGVGPSQHLKNLGIPVIKDLPVGQIMFDHMCHFGPTFTTNTTDQAIFSSDMNSNILSSFLQGQSNTKLSSIGGVEALTFIQVQQDEKTDAESKKEGRYHEEEEQESEHKEKRDEWDEGKDTRYHKDKDGAEKEEASKEENDEENKKQESNEKEQEGEHRNEEEEDVEEEDADEEEDDEEEQGDKNSGKGEAKQRRENKSIPNIELLFTAGSLASDEGTALTQTANIYSKIYQNVYEPLFKAHQDHFTILVMLFHPKSQGNLWLNSKNPLDRPRIDPKYFYNEQDIETILKGIRESIRICEMPAMKKIDTRLHRTRVNGCEEYEFNTDEYWRCSIRVLSYTLHHQVATCRMGMKNDKTSVVNRHLKVHGVNNLRVADTSIIPLPPTAHTNAAAFMIGEKASDMIRTTWS